MMVLYIVYMLSILYKLVRSGHLAVSLQDSAVPLERHPSSVMLMIGVW